MKNPFEVSSTMFEPMRSEWTYEPGSWVFSSLINVPRLNGLQQLSPIPCHKTTGGEAETITAWVRHRMIARGDNIHLDKIASQWPNIREGIFQAYRAEWATHVTNGHEVVIFYRKRISYSHYERTDVNELLLVDWIDQWYSFLTMCICMHHHCWLTK